MPTLNARPCREQHKKGSVRFSYRCDQRPIADGIIWENQLLLDSTLQISSFGEDEAGNLYVADLAGGTIYKIDLR